MSTLTAILTELHAIRELLEWEKADTLEMRVQAEVNKKLEEDAFFKRTLDLYRQAQAEHEAVYHRNMPGGLPSA